MAAHLHDRYLSYYSVLINERKQFIIELSFSPRVRRESKIDMRDQKFIYKCFNNKFKIVRQIYGRINC